MNLRQFHYVLTLANEGSFSRAAETLSISQPSLSQYIKKVEKEVGFALFCRMGGEVRLTDAGKVYIDIGRKMLDLEHQLENKLSDLAIYKSGSITLGISAHRAVALMPQIVVAFKALYPGIILKIVEKTRADLLEAAAFGEFDFAITTLPVDTGIFSYETMFREENVIATRIPLDGEQRKDLRFPAISVHEINNYSFAMLNDEHLMQIELEKLARQHGISLKKEVECSSLEALIAMVKEGIGSAFIPACLATDSSLYYYSIKEATPKRDIVVMYRKQHHLSKVMIDLKQLLISQFQQTR